MNKRVLSFGLMSGALLSVMMLATLPFMDRIGFDRGELIGYSTMVLAFLMVYFGVRSYRDEVAGGSVSFGRAFMVGLAITLVSSCCYVASWQFIYYRLAPDFVDKYATYAIQKAKRAGASAAQVAARENEMAEFKALYENPLVNIGLTFLEPLPVGLLFTLGSAFALSRKRRLAGALAG
jgi:hypothetical protein